MERPDTTQHDSPFDQIKPADLTLGSSGIDAATDAGQRKAGGVFWRGVMIGGLVALALLVILLLPSYVSKSKAPGVDIESLPAGAQKPLTPEKSPWQEAQLGKLRSTAQDILEQLLDRQLQLEQIAVEQ